MHMECNHFVQIVCFKVSLRTHMKLVHKLGRQYTCAYCGKILYSSQWVRTFSFMQFPSERRWENIHFIHIKILCRSCPFLCLNSHLILLRFILVGRYLIHDTWYRYLMKHETTHTGERFKAAKCRYCGKTVANVFSCCSKLSIWEYFIFQLGWVLQTEKSWIDSHGGETF